MACLIISSSHLVMMVSIGFFFFGGVPMIDIFLSPDSARFRDRGIGVADRDRISMPALIFLILSLCVTQNLCSSSITKSPSR